MGYSFKIDPAKPFVGSRDLIPTVYTQFVIFRPNRVPNILGMVKDGLAHSVLSYVIAVSQRRYRSKYGQQVNSLFELAGFYEMRMARQCVIPDKEVMILLLLRQCQAAVGWYSPLKIFYIGIRRS